MNLSPIGIITYSRLLHLQKTIEALKNNTLASASELYIFSDGPKSGDEKKVDLIRNYLESVSGFKRITVIEREENYDAGLNARESVQFLLERYGKMIFMEDDIVTAPSFLEFMNQALDTYEHNPNIFSVTGYCPPIKIPKDYPHNVFLLPRFCAWGFGIWKNRFDLIKFPLPKEEVFKFTASWKNISLFGLGGLDMITKIKKEALGKIDGLDVKAFYYQYKYGLDTVYPVGSLVRNIGLDGTGVHSVKSNFKDVDLIYPSEEWVLSPDIKRNMNILRSNFLFRLRSGKKFRPARGIIWLIPYLIYRLIHKTPFFN